MSAGATPTVADERRAVKAALERAGGSTPAAARALGWPLRTLQRRIAALWSEEERERMRERGTLMSGARQTEKARRVRSERARGRRLGR